MVKKRPLTEASKPDRERQILRAAREEFIEKGISGGRMQAIASRAGVNKALLHYYYRSKEGLYKAALEEILQNVFRTLTRELQKRRPDDDIHALVRLVVSTYINTVAENPDFVRLFLRELADGGRMLQELVKGFVTTYGEIPAHVLAAIAQSQAKGIIRPIKPVHLILNIIGMCVATFVARVIFGSIKGAVDLPISFDRAFYDERIEEITVMAMHGILVKGENT
jgi:AcrR family transcriptional regulator